MQIPQEAISIQQNHKSSRAHQSWERLFISSQGKASVTYEMFYNIDTVNFRCTVLIFPVWRSSLNWKMCLGTWSNMVVFTDSWF